MLVRVKNPSNTTFNSSTIANWVLDQGVLSTTDFPYLAPYAFDTQGEYEILWDKTLRLFDGSAANKLAPGKTYAFFNKKFNLRHKRIEYVNNASGSSWSHYTKNAYFLLFLGDSNVTPQPDYSLMMRAYFKDA